MTSKHLRTANKVAVNKARGGRLKRVELKVSLQLNPVQFAVVREDPIPELELVEKFQLNRPIIIGSGGCTAFALAAKFPEMLITLIEPNSAQTELIQNKTHALKKLSRSNRLKAFGVSPLGASETAFKRPTFIELGNFETLFRGFRRFLYDFVMSRGNLISLVLMESSEEIEKLFKHPYWSVAFDLYFSETLLKTMFGPNAIQHSMPSSYAEYFRTALEHGLRREDRRTNYFLHHILFGQYLKNNGAFPAYLLGSFRNFKPRFFSGTALAFPSYEAFDFVGLSNIFDWSHESEIQQLSKRLANELPKGACVLYRQLNNRKNFQVLFGDQFQWLHQDAKEFLTLDRSLFYTSFHIGRKIK